MTEVLWPVYRSTKMTLIQLVLFVLKWAQDVMPTD